MILQPGTYTFTHNYVTLTYTLGSDNFAEVRSLPTAHYAAQLIGVISSAELQARIEARSPYSPITFEAAPVPVIGKARAQRLHRILGKLGLKQTAHYAFCAAAVQHEVASLACLSVTEAYTVWECIKTQLLSTGRAA